MAAGFIKASETRLAFSFMGMYEMGYFFDAKRPAFLPTQRVIVDGKDEYQILTVRVFLDSFKYDLFNMEGAWTCVDEAELLRRTAQGNLFAEWAP